MTNCRPRWGGPAGKPAEQNATPSGGWRDDFREYPAVVRAQRTLPEEAPV